MEDKITTIKDRVLEIAENKGISKEKFISGIGMTYGSFKGKSKQTPLNSNAVANILSIYSDVDAEWLLTGKGKMKRRESIVNEYDGEIPYNAKPFYNLPVSAGHSLMEIIGGGDPDGYVYNLPGMADTQKMLPVIGYSMMPEVKENAIIGVRMMHQWETLNTTKKYLIVTRDDRMIKYIEHDMENEDVLWCVSPNYPKFKIYKKDIIEIQRVTFVINPE